MELNRSQEPRRDRLALATGACRVVADPIIIDGEQCRRLIDRYGFNHWLRVDGSDAQPPSGPTFYEPIPPTYPARDADGDGTGRS